MALRECSGCGELVSVQLAACPHCKTPRPPVASGVAAERAERAAAAEAALIAHGLPTAPARGGKRRRTAIGLALLLGGVGAHKFYLGQRGWGMVYLVLCWTFLPTIAGLVEGIRYALLSDEEFAARYRA